MGESKYPYRVRIVIAKLITGSGPAHDVAGSGELRENSSHWVKTKKRYRTPQERAQDLSRWMHLRALDAARDSTIVQRAPGNNELHLVTDMYWAMAYCQAHNRVLEYANDPLREITVACGDVIIKIITTQPEHDKHDHQGE